MLAGRAAPSNAPRLGLAGPPRVLSRIEPSALQLPVAIDEMVVKPGGIVVVDEEG